MRTSLRATVLAAAALGAGCGLDLFVENVGRRPHDRPASVIKGSVMFPTAKLEVTDADGKALEPFAKSFADGKYEFRLPSGKYTWLYVTARAGDMTLRAIVPQLGEETGVDGVNLDPRGMTETLIVEARLSADKRKLKQATPDAFLATRDLIRAGFDAAGPTRDLMQWVERLLTKGGDPASGSEPVFFFAPEFNPDYTVKTSALDAGWTLRNVFDYDGDGSPNSSSAKFDAKLAEVARLYRPMGCPDPERMRIMFTVDFNTGRKNGNCGVSDRFKWATDKPGKSMFFVGWIHKESPVQDTLVSNLLGGGTPNQIPMHDDGTAGDETAGDNVWTVYFDVPRGTRVGYKYTWGFRGAPWTGSEEWPGNSRIIEVVDVNGDDIVYRRDVWADEATNKDRANLNLNGTGTIDWTTDLRGYGPEAREQMVDLDNDCKPDVWWTPQSVGPLTVACK